MNNHSKALLVSAFSAAAMAVDVKKRGKRDKSATSVSSVQSGQVRISRNAACSCGSGKKSKKCCGTTAATRKVVDEMAETFLAATKGIPQTVTAMLNAGMAREEAYAYFQTADYICADNRASKSAEACAIWDAHIAAFMEVSPEVQRRILDDITAVKEQQA